MSTTRNYTWDPPDPASVLKINGTRTRKGETFAATDEQVAKLAAAWYVPVKRSDLAENASDDLATSGVRSSTVHVPVPVVLDPETGEHVGGELDIDGALDEAGRPGEANPSMDDPANAAKVRRSRRPRTR